MCGNGPLSFSQHVDKILQASNDSVKADQLASASELSAMSANGKLFVPPPSNDDEGKDETDQDCSDELVVLSVNRNLLGGRNLMRALIFVTVLLNLTLMKFRGVVRVRVVLLPYRPQFGPRNHWMLLYMNYTNLSALWLVCFNGGPVLWKRSVERMNLRYVNMVTLKPSKLSRMPDRMGMTF